MGSVRTEGVGREGGVERGGVSENRGGVSEERGGGVSEERGGGVSKGLQHVSP